MRQHRGAINSRIAIVIPVGRLRGFGIHRQNEVVGRVRLLKKRPGVLGFIKVGTKAGRGRVVDGETLG